VPGGGWLVVNGVSVIEGKEGDRANIPSKKIFTLKSRGGWFQSYR